MKGKYSLNLNHPQHNKYTPQNIIDGIRLEKLIFFGLSKKMGIPLDHNNWNIKAYPNERGADLWNNDLSIYIECKNWKPDYWLKTETVDKFIKDTKNYEYRVLAISYKSDISEKNLEKLESANTYIFETCVKVDPHNWKEALSNLMNRSNKGYWKLNYRLKSKLSKIKKQKEKNKKKNSLKPLSILSYTNPNTNSNNITKTVSSSLVNNNIDNSNIDVISNNKVISCMVSEIYEIKEVPPEPPNSRGIGYYDINLTYYPTN